MSMKHCSLAAFLKLRGRLKRGKSDPVVCLLQTTVIGEFNAYSPRPRGTIQFQTSFLQTMTHKTQPENGLASTVMTSSSKEKHPQMSQVQNCFGIFAVSDNSNIPLIALASLALTLKPPQQRFSYFRNREFSIKDPRRALQKARKKICLILFLS